MIYPKDIVDFIRNDRLLNKRFPTISGIDDLNTAGSIGDEGCEAFEQWMVSEGLERSEAIKRYVFFLKLMTATFSIIEDLFPKLNPSGRAGCDQTSIATSVNDMLCIARYLYYLDSYGVDGCLLECGCFKGWSTCCLSWACHFLGKKLIVADSFQGLPSETSLSWNEYRPGDFLGNFEEVLKNVNGLGCSQSVHFRKGWFAQSLRDFKEPVCLLWIDVDLYHSALDVMTGVFDCLRPGAVIFTHEYDQGLMDQPFGPPAAIFEFLRNKGVSFRTAHATGDFLGLVVPGGEGGVLFKPAKQLFWYMFCSDKIVDRNSPVNNNGESQHSTQDQEVIVDGSKRSLFKPDNGSENRGKLRRSLFRRLKRIPVIKRLVNLAVSHMGRGSTK